MKKKNGFLSQFLIAPIWTESPEENDGIKIENENDNESEHGIQTESANEDSSNNEESSLIDALSGLNLDELGPLLQKFPQVIETLQKLLSSGGGLENLEGMLEGILASLQEKVQDVDNPTEATENSKGKKKIGEQKQIPSKDTKEEL